MVAKRIWSIGQFEERDNLISRAAVYLNSRINKVNENVQYSLSSHLWEGIDNGKNNRI